MNMWRVTVGQGEFWHAEVRRWYGMAGTATRGRQGSPGSGEVWAVRAWHVEVGSGPAGMAVTVGLGPLRQGRLRFGSGWYGRHGLARSGEASDGLARSGLAGSAKASCGTAGMGWQGRVWRAMFRRVVAGQARLCFGAAWLGMLR